MSLKKSLVVLNGFIHDFASGIWLAAIVVIVWLHDAHLAEPSTRTVLNLLEHRLFWSSVAAAVVIMATGAGRTFTYVDNWYGEDAERIDRLRFYCPESMGEREVGFWDTAAKKRFIDTVLVEDPDLLIIDVMNLFFGCEEKDAPKMTHRLMELARVKRLRPRLSILLLHHLRKTVGDQKRVQLRKDPALWVEYSRGSSVLLGHTDRVATARKVRRRSRPP